MALALSEGFDESRLPVSSPLRAPPPPPVSSSPDHGLQTPPTSPLRSPLSDFHPTTIQEAPRSPVKIRYPSVEVRDGYVAQIENGNYRPHTIQEEPWPARASSQTRPQPDRRQSIRRVTLCDDAIISPPQSPEIHRHLPGMNPTETREDWDLERPPSEFAETKSPSRSGTPIIQLEDMTLEGDIEETSAQLHYHHISVERRHSHNKSQSTVRTSNSGLTTSTASSSDDQSRIPRKPIFPLDFAQAAGADIQNRGRSLTPQGLQLERLVSPIVHRRNASSNRSPEARPHSYIDLLNLPYSQQVAQQNITFDNARLRGAVGTNAALLDTKKTLEMYRANVKKTNDPAVQYEFAITMVNAAQDAASWAAEDIASITATRTELIKEARQILQKLADRSYVFAQYFLADGYASGVFSHGGKEDYATAFPLFVSAGKHGHAEAGYRAALCYEFGWGCRRDYAKSVQFYRHSASRNHPGAATRLGRACLTGDMGLGGKYREGIKWLKRATESADTQHNSAPYELGVLHTTGFGDDVFKDEGYAAQLFTRAAELGHPAANLRMGEAYEHGLLTCPRDPALSIHFHNGAALAGLPQAMMALCAWYMIGAQPVLEKDEVEAYAWARKAAKTGYARAEYALGYFTEMGIGTRRDAVEANVWYVRAADHGDERALQRLAIIKGAETEDVDQPGVLKIGDGNVAGMKKKRGIFDWKGKRGNV